MLRFLAVAVVALLSFAASPALTRPVVVGGEPASVAHMAPALRLAGIVEDECKLWNKGCHQSCNDKVPKVVSGGAVIGGKLPDPNAPHNAFQRARMMTQCQATCMAAYPLCKL